MEGEDGVDHHVQEIEREEDRKKKINQSRTVISHSWMKVFTPR